MSTDTKVGMAVVGSGYWGKNLVRNFHSLGALRMVCDSNDALLRTVAEQYPGVDTCMALSGVLTNPEVRAVAISTPAETHFSLARECLLAGKHVFVEKPLTLDEGEALELIRLAEERSLTLMVGHLLQYHSAFVRLKELVLAGELGRIDYVYSNRLNLGKIRREENILWSFAPHDISMILTLAGEEPRSVVTTGGNYLHSRIADVTTTLLEFSSGMRAHVFVSWLHPFKEQKLVVVGERKMAVFNDMLDWPDKLVLYPHQINWKGAQPVPTRAEAERVDVTPSEPLRDECRHFLACAAEGRRPLTDGREGLSVLRVLNASQRSMDRGGAPEVRSADNGESPCFVHPSAYVDRGAALGEGTRIWHFSHVMENAAIGRGCNIGQNVVVGRGVRIGDRCKIQNNVSVYEKVTLEDEVFCGPSMVFTNVHNPRCAIPRMHEARETLVRRGATLGANCTIVCGTVVGRYAFVGAGAVVTRTVADHALMAGVPARRIGWVCACGERLDDDLACPVCGKGYEKMPGAEGLREVDA